MAVTYYSADDPVKIPTVGNAANWHSITGFWYGQVFSTTRAFLAVAPLFRNTSGSTVQYTFELRKGDKIDSPVVHTSVVSVPLTGSIGQHFNVKVPPQEPGTYQFRLIPIGTHPSTSTLGRNTDNPTGYAIFGNATEPFGISTQDVLFTLDIYESYMPKVYYGNDDTSASRSLPSDSYYGMEFTAPDAFSSVHVKAFVQGIMARPYIEIRKGLGADAPVVYVTELITPSAAGIFWWQADLPSPLPAGEYQWRMYRGDGQAVQLQSRTGFDSGRSITGKTTTPTVQTRTSWEFGYRVIPANVQGAKRWTGSGWVDATPKRWTGSAWSPAFIQRVQFPASRQWDTGSIMASIDNGTLDSNPDWAAFQSAYSFTIKHVSTAQTLSAGYRSTGSLAKGSAMYNSGLKQIVDSISVYPMSFFSRLNLDTIYLTNGMESNEGKYAGLASGKEVWINVAAENITRTTHHELQHIMKYTWANDWDGVIQTEWLAKNPMPYMGSNYKSLTSRPAGYTRTYALVSYTEDIAEALAFLMTTKEQTFLEVTLPHDPVLAWKIERVKQWLKTMDPVFMTPYFFEAIHDKKS